MKKAFWSESKVLVIGGGSWGTILAHVIAPNVKEVRLLMRDEDQAREIQSTRINKKYHPNLILSEKIRATTVSEAAFGDSKMNTGVDAVIWALPSQITREMAKFYSPFFSGEELVLHATKGIEPSTMLRVSEILEQELPLRRIGVISGPNLASEMAAGEPAATVVASRFDEVIAAGKALLSSEKFRIYGMTDVVGVEWAGTLKNILGIASGVAEGLGLGWNVKSFLISRGLAEIVRFSAAFGAKESTFLSLAGIGDLIATASSSSSRNFKVGFRLAKNESIETILESLESTAEGITTTKNVYEYAKTHSIEMPITEAVYHLLYDGLKVQDAVKALLSRPEVVTKQQT